MLLQKILLVMKLKLETQKLPVYMFDRENLLVKFFN